MPRSLLAFRKASSHTKGWFVNYVVEEVGSGPAAL